MVTGGAGSVNSKSILFMSEQELHQLIRTLRVRSNRLTEIISTLEMLRVSPSDPRRRGGRKNMPEDERAQVSLRMKKYWAQQRGEAAITA